MLRRVLATWGNADCGRLGHDALSASIEVPRVLSPLMDLRIAGAAAGGAHTAAVTADGAVLTFGLNDRAQLGHSAGEAEVRVPQEVALPEPAAAVAAGHYFTLCLTQSGNVWAWGDNTHGQLGLGGDAGRGSAQPRLVSALRGVGIAGIAAGAEHALAVSRSGEVFTWGCGAAGRLGHGAPAALKSAALRDEAKPRLVRSLETQRVRQVAAGQLHSACVTEEGVLFTFGGGRFHQLGLGADADELGPREVRGVRGVAQAACGGLHTLAALHTGGAAAWGANEHGCLGLGREGPLQARTPRAIPGLSGVEQISAGWKHSAAVTAGGRLWAWGWGGSQGSALSMQDGGSGGGQLGLDNEFDYWQPALVPRLQLGEGAAAAPQFVSDGRQLWRALSVSCGLNHTAAVMELSDDA